MDDTLQGDPLSLPGLIMTKLYPPRVRDQAVARDRVLERLRPEPGIKLTALVAPAGCGKSTTLGLWYELEATRRSMAWLTLDQGDSDPVVLWSYVLEALRTANAGFEVSASPMQVGSMRIEDVVLPQVVNALVGLGDAALVLDDFHRLSGGPARESVAWLIEHAPPSFQLVISSRSEPALPMARLRVREELVEIRANELAFTSDEAHELMNGRLDLGLTRGEIDDLVKRTEGWPAGLYLAALSLRGVQDRGELVRQFGGSNRFVISFLLDEVLEAHDQAAQSLMLRCSILERLCGPVCDAVLATENSRALLDAISQENLFLLPLDDRGEWFRFHHLFGQLLRAELEHREPGLATTLHLRAHGWLREQGFFDEAIEHALQAGAFSQAGDAIAETWVYYANACRYATVLGWLQRFPPEIVREDARLMLVKAWVLSLCARRDEAMAAMAAVERRGGLDEGPLPDGFSSVEASLATLRAAIPWGDVASGYESAVRASELEGPESPYRSVICWGLGAGQYFRGHLDDAARWFEEAAVLAPLAEQWLIEASALAYHSLVMGDLGRLDDQVRLAEEAAMRARERGVEEVDGEVHVALGMSLLARGRPDEALLLLERGVAVLRSWGQPIDHANALICHASALRAVGERGAAASAAAEARAIVDSCADPGILLNRVTTLEESLQGRARLGSAELSERELVVLRLLRSSLSEREIGQELHLSYNTVHSHTRSIFHKLHVSSRSEAVRRARELHLI